MNHNLINFEKTKKKNSLEIDYKFSFHQKGLDYFPNTIIKSFQSSTINFILSIVCK